MVSKETKSTSENIKDTLFQVLKIVAIAFLGMTLFKNISRSKTK